jgi:Fe-S cluster assembly protein SufB
VNPDSETEMLKGFAEQEYKYGFVTNIESDTLPPGLNEDVIKFISNKKGEPKWLTDWRLKAYKIWLKMKEPHWANIEYPPIDYQAISYFSAPKNAADGPKSLDEVDPELIETYNKLGIPLEEQEILAGVAVDAVFDSMSVATTFKDRLAEKGVIFCSFSEAVKEHPELIKKYMGSVATTSTLSYIEQSKLRGYTTRHRILILQMVWPRYVFGERPTVE